jgi:hypothetical protein
MLAAHTTTGDWIVGGIALIVVLGIIGGIIWLLYRLVTWPARARRRRRSGGGLGSDYEQMVRQDKRNQPRSGRSEPFPPPGGWQQPPPQPSRVVMPPPGYRQREPEAHEPETEPVTAAVVAETTTPKPSTWDRLRRSSVRIPPWLGTPLVWLGVVFLIAKPLGGTSWAVYGIALVVAAITAVYVYSRYESKTLLRSGKSIVIWFRRKDDPASVVIEAREAADGQPASLVLRDADKLDDLLDGDLVTPDEYDQLRGATVESPPGDAPTTKTCPECAETVLAAAKVCRYCHYRFDQSPDSETTVVVTPVGVDHPAETATQPRTEKGHE